MEQSYGRNILPSSRLSLQVQILGCSRQWKFVPLLWGSSYFVYEEDPCFCACSWAFAVPCRFKWTLNQHWFKAFGTKRSQIWNGCSPKARAPRCQHRSILQRALSQSGPRICFAFSHLELVYFKGYQAANVAKGKNCYRLYLAENQQR